MIDITMISFDSVITLSLISRREIRAILKMAIKEGIEEAEANHRVYKLDELLAEFDDED